MESWTYCNGEILEGQKLFSMALRAIVLSEWTFTSLRLEDGKVFLFDMHQARLLKGLSYLYPHLDLQRVKLPLNAKIEKSLSHVASMHTGTFHLRVGLVYASPQIDFLPGVLELPEVVMILTPYHSETKHTLFTVGVLEKTPIPWEDAGFKTAFYRDRLRDLRIFKSQHAVQDLVYLTPDGILSDSTTSTLGLYLGDRVQFSPTSPKHFESISVCALQELLPVKLAPIKVSELEAGIPFLVNAVRGIRPIQKMILKDRELLWQVPLPLTERYEQYMSEQSKPVPGKMCVRCKEKPVVHTFRPFCSEKCKLIDLGGWLNESYKVPTKEVPEPDESETHEESND